MRFKRTACIVVLLFVSCSVVVLGIELSTTRLSAEYGQPALDYRSSRAPRSRTETLLLPKQACFHLHLCPINCIFRSVRTAGFEPAISRSPTWRDNQASPRSDRVHVVSSPYGNRTHLAALKGRYPVPIDERAMLCALVERKWAGRCSNPRLRFFRPPLYRLSYQPKVLVRARKNPVSLALVTPGSK
jgi:hypothetical protein